MVLNDSFLVGATESDTPREIELRERASIIKAYFFGLFFFWGGGGLEAKCLCKRFEFLSTCKLLLSLSTITLVFGHSTYMRK